MTILIWFVLGCLHLPPAKPPTLKNNARHFILENGLKVVLDPVHGHGEMVSHLHYRVGEADLLSVDSGLAHLTEHLMFEGSAHVANGDYDRLLNAAGGTSAAYTTHDAMVFTAQFPSEALELLLFLESDRMGWLCEGLTPTDVINQKAVVNQETLGDLSQRTVRLGQLLRFNVFNKTSLSRDPGGDHFRIEEHDLNAVCAFSRQWIQPANAILTLSGHFDPNRVEGLIRRWFSDVSNSHSIPVNHRVWQNTYLTPQNRIKTFSPYTEVLVGWPTVSKGHPDAIALNLILDRLAHPADGLLVNRNIKVDGWVDYTRMGGFMSLRLSGWSHERLLSSLDEAIEDMRSLPPRQLRLSHYRRRAAYIRAWADLSVRAKLLTACIEMGKRVDCVQEQMETEMRVSPIEIRRVIDYWLQPNRRFLVLAGPNDRSGELR